MPFDTEGEDWELRIEERTTNFDRNKAVVNSYSGLRKSRHQLINQAPTPNRAFTSSYPWVHIMHVKREGTGIVHALQRDET